MDNQTDLRAKIMAINNDPDLTDAEKAVKRQELMSGKWSAPADKKAEAATSKPESKGLLDDESLKCVLCFDLCDRPVTGPCQHNYCLGCFKHLVARGNRACPTCRAPLPAKLCENPRINTLLTYAIRMAKQGVKEPSKAAARVADADRPAEAFTTDRAVRSGRANAASGRILVSVPNDHFGPILAEHDPERGLGVQVGEYWADRLDCRQWGAHFPHVAGIAGQSTRGAQSVVLSGGYEDDRDEGEWFMYTGSGGRDLSGNKRTNKTQSFDQEFENMNKALQLSCLKGLPVRVVRSFKEKRSSYAPSQEQPVRYDGIYRILRCWRKAGQQGYLMCRYLFVRCDNAPAPWDSGETGDTPRLDVPAPAAAEMKEAKGAVFQMGDKPYWDYDEASGKWGWAREAPPSQKQGGGDPVKRLKKKVSAHERLLRDFSCGLCKGVLVAPLSMPCGHTFCKPCLDAHFTGPDVVQNAARAMRIRKVPKPCPKCKTDLADYLCSAAVNTEMEGLVQKLQAAAQEARAAAEQLEGEDAAVAAAAGDDNDSGDEQEEEEGEEEVEEEEEGGKAGPSKKRPAAAAAAAAGAGSSKASSSQPQKRQKQEEAAAAAAPSAEEGGEKSGSADGGDTDAAAANDAVAEASADAAAAAAAPVAAAAAPAPASEAAVRYASEAAQLSATYPDYDRGLILMLLEDQGGDLEEVAAYLKRMHNQSKHAARQKSGGGGGSSSSKGAKRGGKAGGAAGSRGKKRQAPAGPEAEEEAEHEQAKEEEEEHKEVPDGEDADAAAPPAAQPDGNSGGSGSSKGRNGAAGAKRRKDQGEAQGKAVAPGAGAAKAGRRGAGRAGSADVLVGGSAEGRDQSS